MQGYQVGSLGKSKYNLDSGPVEPTAAALHGSAIVTPSHRHGWLDPESPQLWLFGIGAVTLGLVAFSTHVRVGKFSADLSGGK